MTLHERLAEPPSRRPKCKVADTLSTLNEADGTALVRAIFDRTFSACWISQECRDEGVSLSEQSINRHRNGVCACGRRT